MKEIEINGIKETIVERSDYPIEQCKENLANEVTAILGYGPQGRGQSLICVTRGSVLFWGREEAEAGTRLLRMDGLKERLSLKQKRLFSKALYFSICFQMPACLPHGLW